MKRILAGLAVAVGAIVAAPAAAHAGAISLSTVFCSTGINVNWSDTHGLPTAPQIPPQDIWTMVIDSVTVNGVPVGFHTVDGLNATIDPITATGVVNVHVTLHWHAVRPNGSTWDSSIVPRDGTVQCVEAPATTTTTTTTVATTTTELATTSSVESGGVTVPPTTTRSTLNLLDVTLPETGRSSGSSVALATVTLMLGVVALGIARRRSNP